MFCIKCGSKVEDGEKFCTGCGVSRSKETEIMTEEQVVNKENKSKPMLVKLVALAGVVISVSLFAFLYQSQDSADATEGLESPLLAEEPQYVPKDNAMDYEYFNEAELVDFTKSYIEVLQRLYYINQDDSPDDAENTSALLIIMTTEALKDQNNLKRLLFTTNEMQDSKIVGASVTASVVGVTVESLIAANEEYIQFLRSVDESTLDIAEFQFQVALFQSSTKDAYMFMAEKTQLFQVTFFQLNDDPELAGEWRISDKSRQDLVNEIEMRFSDIYIEADGLYTVNQTRDVTVYLVRALEDLFRLE